MSYVDIYIRGHDQASRAAQDATTRLEELRAEMARVNQLQAQGVKFSIGDLSQIRRAQSEINSLEKGLTLAGNASQGAGSQFSALQGVLGQLGVSIPGIGAAGLAAGVAAVGVVAGKAALGLEAMREESAQVEARFVGFTGSAGAAKGALAAFDAAVGNALTRDEKMAAATQLLGLGLADTAADAAELTREALILGIDLDKLTQALETGRATGLVQYGISLTDMKNRAEELQRQTTGLSDTEAKAIAIKEQLAAKAQAVADAGGVAATAIQGLKNSWQDLLDTAAEKINLEGGLNDLTRGVQALEAIISGKGKVASGDGPLSLLERIADYISPQKELTRATAEYDAALADVKTAQADYDAAMAAGQTMEADSKALRLEVAKATLDHASAARTAAEAQNAEAASAAGTAVQLRELASATTAVANADALRWAAQGAAAQKTQAAADADEARARNADALRWAAQGAAAQKAMAAANTATASDYQRKMESAGERAATKIGSYLSQGQNFSIGLNDMRGGGNLAPGKNGAFEDIYRLQAWLSDGSWGDVGQKLAGGDKEKAKKIITDFQRGIFSPDVIAGIDTGALAKEAQMDALAEKTQTAFVDALTAQSGASNAVVRSLLGLSGGKDGAAAADAMNALAVNIGKEVNAKEFSDKIADYGLTTWSRFEGGFVGAARSSTALAGAIDAMVRNSLAKYGVSGAMRETGQ